MRVIGSLENLPKWCLILPVLAGAVFFCAACPARALGEEKKTSPEAIEKHLQELMVIYKQDHPEVLRYQRALEKARENEASRKTEEMRKERQSQQESAPSAGPATDP